MENGKRKWMRENALNETVLLRFVIVSDFLVLYCQMYLSKVSIMLKIVIHGVYIL